MAKVTLKGMNRKQLEKLRADIDAALAKVGQTELKAAREAAEKAAKAHGYSLADLAGKAPAKAAAKAPAKGKKRGPKPGKKSPPKYANPADSKQTWTGKGRKPNWFVEGLASGKLAEDFAI